MGLSDVLNPKDLEKRLEKLKFIGFIPQIQLTLLQLAEMHFLEGRQKEAGNYLKEAVNIYKEFGISACFYSLPLKSSGLLQKIDLRLYTSLDKNVIRDDSTRPETILSAREKEIMKLIALGKTNEEMSKQLFIGIGTIKWHINNIFGKLGVKNRVQAIEKARSTGEI